VFDGQYVAMRRWAILFGLAIAIVVAASLAVFRALPKPLPVVDRQARLVSESPYAEEVRCLFLCGWSYEAPTQKTYSGPGHFIRYSGDGNWVAVTVSGCSEGISRVVGVFAGSEHCYVHNIEVRRVSGDDRRPILTVYDKEPGSGSAHRYRWSEDSKALLLFGEAGLQEHPDRAVDLRFVYQVSSDELTRLAKCPINKDAPMKDMVACRQSKRCV
jgi:hypothetical protein